MKTAVIVIDMINDFVTGVFKSDRAAKIVPNVKTLLDFARKKKIPIVYATDAHLPNVDPEFSVWGSHAVAGTRGAEIVDELKPDKCDFRVLKRKYSAFQGTDLDQLLRELEVDTVVLTGVVTDICIQHTAADAFFRGYKIKIPKDATEAFTENAYTEGLQYLKEYYNAEITETDRIIKEWR